MIAYYVVDAFADAVFQGNPAGVCLLEEDLPDQLMQRIAAENNLSETAFLRREGETYRLRWFTPTFEIDLCGHATLASAHVVCTLAEPGRDRVDFLTRSGTLRTVKRGELYEMTLPSRRPARVEVTQAITSALGVEPLEVWGARDLCILLEDEAAVRAFTPDYGGLLTLTDCHRPGRGLRLCVTVFLPGAAAGGPGDGVLPQQPRAAVGREAGENGADGKAALPAGRYAPVQGGRGHGNNKRQGGAVPAWTAAHLTGGKGRAT